MIPHILIIDDEEDVLESMVPGLINDLVRRLPLDETFQQANRAAGFPLPQKGRLNVRLTAGGYESEKVKRFAYKSPVHLRVHLCCEKGTAFRHVLRQLREHFIGVVVSDLRFAEDAAGSRAGRLLIDDVGRRNPETFGILYSAYQKPDGFPSDRFVRKGSASNLGGEELVAKIVEGVATYLTQPSIKNLCLELSQRGLVYQSDEFGAMLRRLYDYAHLYFEPEPQDQPGRRRPRPTLLIDGETGTGKTELAALLHSMSQRRTQPFVSATCNQLSDENFLRSILFGHIKGSFSGAHADRPGLVQSAGQGTLLLDDLHKLSDGCSLILHSFLDDGEYSHLGEDEVRRSSLAAIVCTVETPHWEEIKQQQLLADSFINRVEQLVIRVPPLRQRPEDVEHQAVYYTTLQSEQLGAEMELSPQAVEWLIDYGFPGGNSRRLRDFLKGVITSHARVTDYLEVADLEEYAHDTRLLRSGTPRATGAPSTGAAPSSAASDEARSDEWPPADEEGWEARVAVLATQALIDEHGLSAEAADQVCRELFLQRFPELWSEFTATSSVVDGRMDVKLFEELFRYFVVYREGNPVNAAKALLMKDNALREYIYSREQRRLKK